MVNANAQRIWEAALGEIQLQVTRTNYDTWLKDTVGLAYAEHRFVIGAPNAFATEWLQKRLRSLIRKILAAITKEELEVQFQTFQPSSSLQAGDELAPLRPSAVAAATASLSPAPPHAASSSANSRTRLNARYTFNSFIVGSSNRLAHAAALAVSENPGLAYNPLFLYGGVGLGKTHLLQAVGCRCQEKGLSVLYVTSERFTNDFINAIRENKTEAFDTKYRSADVLLVDDIQFIADKERTQESFFHTFNDLHNASCQIVLSSDRSPSDMPLLADRLRSRFEWGLTADIQPPDFETRLAILRARAAEQAMTFPDAVLEVIARRVQSNIRSLEESLNRLILRARVSKAAMTPELAAEALADLSPEKRQRLLSPPQILAGIAAFFQTPIVDLTGPRRTKDIVTARHVAMYLLREELQLPFSQIGQLLGGRDHSTVLHGYEKVAREIRGHGTLYPLVQQVRENIYRHP